jgi:hypothetical protein
MGRGKSFDSWLMSFFNALSPPADVPITTTFEIFFGLIGIKTRFHFSVNSAVGSPNSKTKKPPRFERVASCHSIS